MGSFPHGTRGIPDNPLISFRLAVGIGFAIRYSVDTGTSTGSAPSNVRVLTKKRPPNV
jgi:hypothetical protein